MTPTTDTPRTDTCPHCGAEVANSRSEYWEGEDWVCGSNDSIQSPLCREREARQKAEAEVERLRGQLIRAVEIAKQYTYHAPDCDMVIGENNGCDCGHSMAMIELDQIKATLNPDNK